MRNFGFAFKLQLDVTDADARLTEGKKVGRRDEKFLPRKKKYSLVKISTCSLYIMCLLLMFADLVRHVHKDVVVVTEHKKKHTV